MRKIQSGFSKGKVVFSPYYFLICFKGLLGVTLSLKSVFKRLNKLRVWEKKEEKKEKGETTKISPRMPISLSDIRRWRSL